MSSIPGLSRCGALAAVATVLLPGLAAAAPITAISTTSNALPDPTGDDYSPTLAPAQQLNFNVGGAPDDLFLNGLSLGVTSMETLGSASRVEFRRVNNAAVTTNRQILWYQIDTRVGDTYNLNPSRATDMEDSLLGPIINRGTDNVFDNDGGVNINNVERIDYIYDNGLTAQVDGQLDFGFAIMDRGGNDQFRIAAITGMAAGAPTSYATLLLGGAGAFAWGPSLTTMRTAVVQGDDPAVATDYRVTADVSTQNIDGIFFSLRDLGLLVGQTIYGYSIFSNDVNPATTPAHVLTDVTTFPTTGGSGLDLVSGGLAFNPAGADTTDFLGVPEPGTYALFGLGMLGLALARRRRKRSA
jgi:hypothetical protein